MERQNRLAGIVVEASPIMPEEEEVEARRPIKLSLKTCIYNADQEINNAKHAEDENGDLSCVICFSEIEGGQRVGALSCRHIFHVECLKSWLARKNSCPLCQQMNAAIPLYGDAEGNHEQTPIHGIEDATDQSASL